VHTNDENAWDLYQKLQRNGDLPIRAFLTPSFDEIKNETAPAPKSQDGLISVDRVKIFSDGSLGAVSLLTFI
jgi:predicted amidohydrolase YtcJ